MKFIIYTSLTLAFFLTACSTSKNNSKAKKMNTTGIPLAPEVFKSKIERTLSSGEGMDTVVSFIDYEFYSTPKSPWQDSINHWIGDFLHATSALESGKYEYRGLTHEFFYNALKQFEVNFESVRNVAESQGVWFYEATVDIDQSFSNYAQVSGKAFFYTGGAHPNSSLVNGVYSKDGAHKLKLTDVTSDVLKFNMIAEKHFRKARGIGKNQDLKADFWFEHGFFACNDNFKFDSNGITFTFNAYEVAPYYLGPTEFTVPLREVSEILKIKL